MILRRSIVLVTLVLAVPGCDDSSGQPDGGVDATQVDAGYPDAPVGTVCGGFLGTPCAASEYCDYLANGCGSTDETGVCRPRPVGCPDLVFMATCGCDGQVYGNECEVYLAGSDLNAYGSCPVPVGSFACGWTQCSLMTQYCEHVISDVANEPDAYACMPLPGCPSQFPNCSCLATEPCGAMCSGDAQVGLTLTCPGG